MFFNKLFYSKQKINKYLRFYFDNKQIIVLALKLAALELF